jgi:hypothetical protein
MHKYKGNIISLIQQATTHFLCYAIGDNPYGPFTLPGRHLKPGGRMDQSPFDYRIQWQMVFILHDVQLSGKTHLRNVKMTELKYNDDGPFNQSLPRNKVAKCE